eukprot:TRINITY_DN937_c0_g1_i2.p1 TRINITY_DN937_c0_g1~~TRINITY_DN937_c0_g1_i2.p1  ORF type:complete len:163 (+),score=31.95 TRINITY_DN937_c0_g1_i2:224-712(+)
MDSSPPLTSHTLAMHLLDSLPSPPNSNVSNNNNNTKSTPILSSSTSNNTAPISDELLLSLHFLFGNSLESALDIIDRQMITHIVSVPSGREMYHFQGKSKKVHFASKHYCTCMGYKFGVILRGDSLLCKHQLAAYFASPMAWKIRRREISDVEYDKIVYSPS